MDENQIDSRINLGLVIKGDISDIKRLLKIINESIGNCRIIFDKFSDDELWIVSGKQEDISKTNASKPNGKEVSHGRVK